MLPAPPGVGLDMQQSQTGQGSLTPLPEFPHGTHKGPRVALSSCFSTSLQPEQGRTTRKCLPTHTTPRLRQP